VRLLLDGTNVSAYASIKDPGKLADSDLGAQIATLELILGDRSTADIPKVPRYGMQIEHYADDAGLELTFGGRISDITQLDRPVRRAWRLGVQSHDVRVLEAPTGSLNKAGIVDTDRAFIIAILTDALAQHTFGASTGIDDPIYTANAAIGWSGVKATTRLAGKDWSYVAARRAIDDVLELVANVTFRIRPDKIVEYGRPRARAPYVIVSAGASATTSPDEPKRKSLRDEFLASAPGGYWRLGEGCNDASAIDASGNGRTGTYNGNPLRGVAGGADDWDPACSFDGVDDYVSVAHHADIDIATAGSLVVLFRPFDVGSLRGIASKTDAGLTNGWEISNSSGVFRVTMRNPLTDISAGALVARRWYVGGWTYDGANVRTYLDGVLVGGPTARTATIANGSALEIGRRPSPAWFLGDVDEVAVFKGTVLSGAQMLTIARARLMRRVAHGGYTEQELVAGHRNTLRRGGAGAAEETAIDQVSYARFRRLLEAAYVNDESIPSSVLRQMAYAELRGLRVRRTASTRAWTRGAIAGQQIDVVSERLGNLGRTGSYIDTFLAINGRDKGGVAHNYRGRMTIQKVAHAPLGNRQHELELQLGDNKRDMPTAIAVLAGRT
jgi:hypothetical protein